MHADRQLKRFFPAVVVLLLGTAAYFQAKGMVWLLAVMEPKPASAASLPNKPSPKVEPQPKDRTADALAILSRNPFDSNYQPGGPPNEVLADPEAPCPSARVLLILESEEASWSFASIASSNGKTTLRRVGDDVGGYKIDQIDWDRVTMTSGSGARCQMVLGDKAPPPAALAQNQTPKQDPKKQTKPLLSEGLSSQIHRINETHIEVERPVITQILQNQEQLLDRTRAVMEKGEDGTTRLRVSGIRNGSLLDTLGLQNGDRLQSINGLELSDPSKLVQAYPKLLTADRLTVSLVRRDKPMEMEVIIK